MSWPYVLILCILWEALAVVYTREAANARRDLRGYARLFFIAALIGVSSVLSIAMTVLHFDAPHVVAWIMGTAIGAVVGLATGVN